MRILHLSDLHVTGENESLEQVWVGPRAAIERDELRFDYIVVSGDLSDRATKREYDELLAFTDKHLLPLLLPRPSVPLRTRVVFVPGNHDVQWDARIFEPKHPTEMRAEELRELVRNAKRSPQRSNARLVLGDLGHVELYTVDPSKYVERFANVAAFFDSFYGDVERASLKERGGRSFELRDAASAWSAHVFPEDNVAFFGLSSCEHNDRHWHGASFASRALVAVQQAVLRLARVHPGMLFVAVWHHGFISELGRPDRLGVREVSDLYNLGFRLGFHGHTHQDHVAHHDFLGGRIAIVATGSLGAGNEQLPPGVRNQFSVVDVFPRRVDVRRYQADDPQSNVFASGHATALPLRAAAPRPAKHEVQVHRRLFEVNRQGILKATVAFEGVDSSRRLPLAIATPPFCSVHHQPTAETNLGPRDVDIRYLPDGRVRFHIDATDVTRIEKWTYYASNSVALTRSELSILPDRRAWFPNLGPFEDSRAHIIRFECERFLLELRFEEHAPSAARVIVEARREDGSEPVWVIDEQESARATRGFTYDPTAKSAVLSVDGPIVGHRYAIAFEPPDVEPPFPPRAADLSARLLRRCRDDQYASSALRERLTRHVETAIEGLIGVGAEEWTGLLWQPSRRKLFTSFGRFPARTWATRFEAGSGVAGHAFRHSDVVAWMRRPVGAQPQEVDTIYQEHPESRGHGSDYRWVLCVPILLGHHSTGPCIGVIGFAGAEPHTAGERRLHALAQNWRSLPWDDDLASDTLGLMMGVSVAFWQAVESAPELEDVDRRYAASVLAALVQEAK